MTTTTHTRESINAQLAARGIVMVDSFTGTENKHRFICEKDHVWHKPAAAVIAGAGCYKCHEEKLIASKTGFIYVAENPKGAAVFGVDYDPQRQEAFARFTFERGTGFAAWTASKRLHGHLAELGRINHAIDGVAEVANTTPAELCEILRYLGGTQKS